MMIIMMFNGKNYLFMCTGEGDAVFLLLRHSAKSLNAQEERQATSP